MILVALLLLPDFAEIAVPGLISLRRRVEGQELKQSQLEERLSVALNNNASAQVILADPLTLQNLLRDVDAKEGLTATTPESGSPPDVGEEDERGRLSVQLLQKWERLSAAEREALRYDLGAAPTEFDISSLGLSISDAVNQLANWRNNFKVELEYVRAARNAIAHAQSIEIETLRRSVELAAKLEAALPFNLYMSYEDRQRAYRDFHLRAIDWITSQGVVEVTDLPLALQRYDFVGKQDGRWVILEARLGTRWLTGNALRNWSAVLMHTEGQFPSARRILVVKVPGLDRSGWKAVRDSPVDMFIEEEPGNFVPLVYRESR